MGAFDKEHIKKLKALGSCPSCDLSNANLDGANLEWTFLLGANLKGANLYWSDLSKEIFCDTTMSDGTINNRDCQ